MTGCGSGNGSATLGPIADGPATTRSQYGPFAFTLAVPRIFYKRGESVPVTFSVTNVSSNNVTTQISVSSYPLWVQQGNKLIWKASTDGARDFRNDVFAPGETKTFLMHWDFVNGEGQGVIKGSYNVYARYTAYTVMETVGQDSTPVETYHTIQFNALPIEVTLR